MKSVLKARSIEEKLFHLIGYKDGEVVFEFPLNKKKMMVGRCPQADIFIDDSSLSFYHAFIVIDQHGGKIIDLDSDNGIYLNGQRTEKTFFADGDVLRFGPIELHIQERTTEVDAVGFEDQDAGIVEKMDEAKITELPPELPPMPGLVVIDGEYCDIVFDDENFDGNDHVAATEGDFDFKEFIDPEELADKDIQPISRKKDELAVEVTVLLNGNVLSIDYLPLKNKTYFASALGRHKGTISIPCLEDEDRLPFIDIDGTDIKIHKLPNFSAKNRETGQEGLFENADEARLMQKDVIIYDLNTVQIVIRVKDAPPSLKAAPFFGREREFQKEAGKIFGTIMGIMLMLLFIDTTVEVPKKKIAVIYRKAIKAKKKSDNKSKAVADKKDKDTGVKKNKQPVKDTKMAKKSPNKAPPKKKKPQKQKKVAKAAPAAPKKVQKKPKMKAYKFKSNTKLSSLFGSTKNLKPSKINKNTAATGTTGFKSIANVSDSNLSAKSNGPVGTLGKDLSGKYDSSSGAQGLSSKSGVDTAYSDPKTVVLGSMDPELLRKILKEYLPQFRHCYQQELERNEAAKGVIDLHFRINPNGSVSKIKIKGKRARFSRAGSGCMAGVLKLIDFPNPKGGGVVDVKQPLNFFSEQDNY